MYRQWKFTGLCLAVILAACDGGGSSSAASASAVAGPAIPTVSSVIITNKPIGPIQFGSCIQNNIVLGASVVGANNPSQGVKWTSYGTNVLQVDATTGVLTVVGIGSAVVNAASLFDPTKSDQATLTVVPANCGTTGGASSIAINPSTGSGFPSATLQLNAVLTNMSGTGNWTSSNSSVVSVDQTGKITYVSVGGPVNVCFTSGTVQGCGQYTTLNPATNTFSLGSNQTLTLSGNGQCSVSYTIPATYNGSQVSVAYTQTSGGSGGSISNGVFIGTAPGTYVYSSTYNGLTATVTFTVVGSCTTGTGGPTSLSINPASVTLAINQHQTFTVTPNPAGTVTNVSWSTPAGSCLVLPYGQTGLQLDVYGQSACTTTLTATAPNGVSATSQVTVQNGAPNFGGPYSLSICTNSTVQISVPSGVTISSWSSNPSGIVTISSSGLVTVGSGATAGQSVTVTGILSNGQSGTATLNLVACNTGGPASLSVSPSSVVLLVSNGVGQSQVLTVTPTPAGSVTSLMLGITQNGCGSISTGADLLHPVLKALLPNCSGTVTVTAQNGVSASMTFSTIAGTVTCSVSPPDGTNFHKGVHAGGAASCTSPTGKVYRPFWSSSIGTTLSVNGSDGTISIGGVSFQVGTTADFNPLNLGDVVVTVQPEITDGAPSDMVHMNYHVIP